MQPTHSFGGRSLDRYVYEYELPEDGGDPGLGDPEQPAEPAEPAWSVSREDWEANQQALAYLAEAEQRRAQMYVPPDNGNEPVRPDPFSDTFQDDLDRYINSRLAPVQQIQTDTQLAEAEERAMDILGDLATKDGDFDRSVARLRADSLLPEMQAKYGFGPRAAEAALEAAAAQQRAYEQKVREDAVAQHTNHLATLAGAPGEPGSTYTAGVQTRTTPDYAKGGSVTGQFFGPNARR